MLYIVSVIFVEERSFGMHWMWDECDSFVRKMCEVECIDIKQEPVSFVFTVVLHMFNW